MAITYPLALPSELRWRTVGWREIDVTADVASPFTGQSQVVAWPGQWFACTLTLVAMNRAQAQLWDAWITSLFGHTGSFLMGMPLRALPLGPAGGTPLVKGAGQTGNSLAIDGCTPSIAGWLKAGDPVQLGSGATARLHKNLTDVATNSSGEATLDLWPALREVPADNAALVVSGARGLFHRASPVTDWKVGPGGMIAERSFDAKERLT